MARYHPGAARIFVPLHGILAAFPLAFFVAAFFSDWAYARSANMQWANFSVWLIAGGVLMAVAAGVAGIVDALVLKSAVRRRSSLHSILTVAMLVTAIVNGFVHSRDGWTSVVPTGIILSAITALLVLVTSWIGYSVRSETLA
ncbi:DUF2231 domain-containing protein [Sphingomonas sp. KR3-1]|uniref:DUF2231 domain-containing protein n=1 Tax=Sphingomonas sp. KR3-1 TaxID=3156611 RepID=UPI0032B629CD